MKTAASVRRAALWMLASHAVAATAASIGFTGILNDPTPTRNDEFGTAVAVNESWVLVGAGRDSTVGDEVGQAHVFSRQSGQLVWTFDDPSPTWKDFFGSSVALEGDLALIGARGDDTNGIGFGQAHLFDLETGQIIRTFDPPTPTQFSGFGSILNLNGGRALIHDASGAHLFDVSSGQLLRTFTDPTPDGSFTEGFSGSAAMVDDLVLLGEASENQAHLFNASNGLLIHTFEDPTPTGEELFGRSVSISGDVVAIGSQWHANNGRRQGEVHLFRASTGELIRTLDAPNANSAAFGRSVVISGDDLFVGDHEYRVNGNLVGQVYWFDATSGSLIHTFNDRTPTTNDLFGDALAVSDGLVAIGAFRHGSGSRTVGEVHLVPEPSAVGLGAVGLLGASGWSRPRRG